MNFKTTIVIVIIAVNTSFAITCSQVFVNPKDNNSLYFHSKIFSSDVTQNDIEAFKYYCANNKVASMIDREIVSTIIY